MKKNILLSIISYLFFVIIVIIQISFLNNTVAAANYYNLILIILILLILIYPPGRLLFFIFTAGFLFDLYSNFSFGIYLLTFLISVLTVYFSLNTFFTHYSPATILTLVPLAVIEYNLFLWLATKLLAAINLNSYVYQLSWWPLLIQTVGSTITVLVFVKILHRSKIKLRFKL